MNEQISSNIRKNAAPIQFKQTIGLFKAVTLGVGAMLGAGLYVLIGIAAKEAGANLYLSYILCTVLTFFTVLMYGELAKHTPKNGGGYYYAYKSLGSFWGFMVGWHLAIGSIFACALYASGFSSYAASFVWETPSHWAIVLLGVVAVLVLWGIGLRAHKNNDAILNIITWGNVAILLTIAAMGFFVFDSSNYHPPRFDETPGIGTAISIIYISFFGFQLIANNSEEVKHPQHNVPRAMLLALTISAVIYFLVVLAAVGSVGVRDLAHSEAPLLRVAQASIGDGGMILIGIGGILASVAALSSTMTSQARQIFAMGKYAMLPKIVGSITKKSKLPIVAFSLGALLTIFTIIAFDITFIAKTANFALLFSMLPVSFALIKQQKTTKEPSKFKRAIPWITLSANGALLLTLDSQSLLFGGVIIGSGCGVFLAYSRSSEIRSRSGFSVSLSETQQRMNLVPNQARILLPLGNINSVEPLFKLSKALLPANDSGEIVALSVALTIDGTQPRMMLHNQTLPDSIIQASAQAMRLAKEYQTNVRPVVRASRTLSSGIRHAAREEHCNLIVMGWTQSERGKASTLLKDVVTHTNMDFVFLNIKQDSDVRHFKKIGVAIGGYANLQLLVKVSGMMAEQSQGQVNYINVIPDNFNKKELDHAKNILGEAISVHSALVPCHTRLFSTDNPLQGIIDYTSNLDLLVIGSAQAGDGTEDNVVGSFSTMIIERAHCSVVIARRTPGLGRIVPRFAQDMFTFEEEIVK